MGLSLFHIFIVFGSAEEGGKKILSHMRHIIQKTESKGKAAGLRQKNMACV